MVDQRSRGRIAKQNPQSSCERPSEARPRAVRGPSVARSERNRSEDLRKEVRALADGGFPERSEGNPPASAASVRCGSGAEGDHGSRSAGAERCGTVKKETNSSEFVEFNEFGQGCSEDRHVLTLEAGYDDVTIGCFWKRCVQRLDLFDHRG